MGFDSPEAFMENMQDMNIARFTEELNANYEPKPGSVQITRKILGSFGDDSTVVDTTGLPNRNGAAPPNPKTKLQPDSDPVIPKDDIPKPNSEKNDQASKTIPGTAQPTSISKPPTTKSKKATQKINPDNQTPDPESPSASTTPAIVTPKETTLPKTVNPPPPVLVQNQSSYYSSPPTPNPQDHKGKLRPWKRLAR
ncbi:extensin-like [Papaver somniferum]|uniref:extensin-like n=1 Tax=Papaver somniferum TaxID=3469 RepID=UPI000E702847|nr:extensin-like [Papaver somniferum]